MTNAELKFMELTPNRLKDIQLVAMTVVTIPNMRPIVFPRFSPFTLTRTENCLWIWKTLNGILSAECPRRILSDLPNLLMKILMNC